MQDTPPFRFGQQTQHIVRLTAASIASGWPVCFASCFLHQPNARRGRQQSVRRSRCFTQPGLSSTPAMHECPCPFAPFLPGDMEVGRKGQRNGLSLVRGTRLLPRRTCRCSMAPAARGARRRGTEHEMFMPPCPCPVPPGLCSAVAPGLHEPGERMTSWPPSSGPPLQSCAAGEAHPHAAHTRILKAQRSVRAPAGASPTTTSTATSAAVLSSYPCKRHQKLLPLSLFAAHHVLVSALPRRGPSGRPSPLRCGPGQRQRPGPRHVCP